MEQLGDCEEIGMLGVAGRDADFAGGAGYSTEGLPGRKAGTDRGTVFSPRYTVSGGRDGREGCRHGGETPLVDAAPAAAAPIRYSSCEARWPTVPHQEP